MNDDRPVIVVGAGIAGLAVAAHLGPERVHLIERAPSPAQESTADGVGMIRRLTDDPLERSLALRTAAWMRGREHVRTTGALLLSAHDRTGLNDGVAHLRAAGVTVEEVRSEDIAPALAPATGWYVPDELTVEPPRVARALADDVIARGARFEGGATVTGLRIVGGRAVGVETDRGPRDADAVVLATGAWSAGLAARQGLRRPLSPLRRNVFELSASGSGPWAWIDDVGLYLRPTERGFLASPCDEGVEPDPRQGSRGAGTAEAEALLREKLRRFAPSLAEAPVLRSWSGLRTFAPDRRPVLGEDPELPGLWWVAGLGGAGLTCGWAAAEAVATWMTGGDTPWLRGAPVSPGRRFLARWPIRPTGRHDGARLVPA